METEIILTRSIPRGVVKVKTKHELIKDYSMFRQSMYYKNKLRLINS